MVAFMPPRCNTGRAMNVAALLTELLASAQLSNDCQGVLIGSCADAPPGKNPAQHCLGTEAIATQLRLQALAAA